MSANTFDVCQGSVASLTATGFLPNSTTITPGNYSGTVVSVSPLNTTIYQVSGLDLGGCPKSNTFQIGVYPSFTINSSAPGLCPGSISTLQATGNFTAIVWQPGNYTVNPLVITIPNSTVWPTAFTMTATGTFSNGCTVSQVFQRYWLDLDPGQIDPVVIYPGLCIGQSETITVPGSIITPTWIPSGQLGTLVVTPSVTTTYSVLTGNAFGCMYLSTVQVNVLNSCCTNTGTVIANMTSTQQTLTGTRILNGTLTLLPNSNLTLNGEIIMNQNAKIIVPQSATLYIRNSHLYSCSSMWSGIEVQNGGSVIMEKVSSSNLIEDAITAVKAKSGPNTISITSTTFNKNYVAIDILNVGTTSNFPLTVRNCVFTCRSLAFNSTQWPQTGTVTALGGLLSDLRYTSVNINSVLAAPYLVSNTFTIAMLKAPYTTQSSQLGIKLASNQVGTNFTVGDASNNANFNVFDAQGTGIEAVNCNLNSYNNTFQNTQLISGSFNSGIRAVNNYTNWSNMNTNLNLVSTSNPTVNINRFYNCHVGIEAINQSTLAVRYAQLSSTQATGTPVSLNTQGYYGIYINSNNFKNYLINSNRFYNLNTGVFAGASADWVDHATNKFGQVWGTFSVTANLFCPSVGVTGTIGTSFVNEAVHIETAVRMTNASAVAGSSHYSDWSIPPISLYNILPYDGLKIVNNNMYKVYNGVYVNGFFYSGFTKTTANNIIQLSLKNGANVTQRGVNHTYNYPSVINSNTVIGFSPNNSYTVSGIYNSLNAGGSTQCNSVVTVPRGFEFYQPSRPHTWKGNWLINHAYGLYANAWGTSSGGGIGQQGASNSPIDNFWQGSTWSTSNLQTFTDLNSRAFNSILFCRSVNGYSLVTTFNDGLPSNLSYQNIIYRPSTNSYSFVPCSSIAPLAREWRDIPPDSLDFSDPTIETSLFVLFMTLDADSLLLAQGGDTLQGFYENKVPEELGQITDIEAALSSGQYNFASALINAFSPQTNMQHNYRDFFSYYLSYKTLGNISANDSLNLTILASQCPATDGPAVYKARALFTQIYGIIWEYNDDNCVPEGFVLRQGQQTNFDELKLRESIHQQKKLLYKIYPNPLSSDLFLTGAEANKMLRITIIDVTTAVALFISKPQF